MISRAKHKVNFELIGGLGNQLFQWVAAIYFKTHTNNQTQVDLTYCSSRFQSHSSLITELEFEPKFELDLIQIRNSKFTHLAEQVTSQNRYLNRLRNLVQKRFVPATNGFVEGIATKDQRIFRGYFQTYRYLQAITDVPLKVKLKNHITHSDSFEYSGAVAIHVRRGDYLNLKNSFGVLSNDYYLNALNIIKSQINISQVVIFSNDTTAANLLRTTIGSTAKVFSDYSNESDAATLVALSEFNYIITANSSFSWWAAMINKKKVVVYPNPWFKSFESPNDLIPPDWIPCPATWID